MNKIFFCTTVLLLLFSPSIAQSRKQKPAPTWVRVNATLEDKGDTYIVRSRRKGGGAIETAKSNVRRSQRGTLLRVRGNTDARIVEPPTGSINTMSAATLAADCHRQEDCPSKCASCIPFSRWGLCVRVCCGEGGTRGVAVGVWGCP